MNLSNLHITKKEVSAVNLFRGKIGTSMAIQLKEKVLLKEHITKTAALLLCVNGNATYSDEKEQKIELFPGDFINIAPNLKHWIEARVNSHLILLK